MLINNMDAWAEPVGEEYEEKNYPYWVNPKKELPLDTENHLVAIDYDKILGTTKYGRDYALMYWDGFYWCFPSNNATMKS